MRSWTSIPRDLDRAWSAYRTGDYDQCLRLARRAGLITDDTRLVLRSLEMQARGALGLKRPDMARQYLDRMLAIAPALSGPFCFGAAWRCKRAG